MCKWIDESTADRLPAYADHFLGVGGILVNDKLEVLMIQEKRRVGEAIGAVEKPWKFPGGFVDHGETVRQGVEREVLEETGIRGEFQGLLAMREQIDFKYGAADLYMVCILKPSAQQEVDIQDTQEVSAARWIPLSEITTNEDGCKYKLFSNAFQFVTLVRRWLKMTGKLPLDAGENAADFSPSQQADLANTPATEVLKLQTLGHRSQVNPNSRPGKEKIWNFYMPCSLDSVLSGKL